MTEERADYAAAPGPIDPRDFNTLGRIVRNEFQIHGISNGQPWDQIGERRQSPHMDAGAAVARAVCPEHHAVFDTRTHVAVPVAELKQHAYNMEFDLVNCHGETCGHVSDFIDWLCDLLPTESEEAR